MTQAEFTALRPVLAALIKVPVTQFPVQLLPSTNLSKIGNTLNVAVGERIAGGGFNLYGGNFIAENVPVSYCTLWDYKNTAWFVAPINGLGTYLMTIYVNATTTRANVHTFFRDRDTNFYSPSSADTVEVQGGKLCMVKVVTSANAKEVGVWLSPIGNSPVTLFSCDFVRVQ